MNISLIQNQYISQDNQFISIVVLQCVLPQYIRKSIQYSIHYNNSIRQRIIIYYTKCCHSNVDYFFFCFPPVSNVNIYQLDTMNIAFGKYQYLPLYWHLPIGEYLDSPIEMECSVFVCKISYNVQVYPYTINEWVLSWK